jgi:hypothetical protein
MAIEAAAGASSGAATQVTARNDTADAAEQADADVVLAQATDETPAPAPAPGATVAETVRAQACSWYGSAPVDSQLAAVDALRRDPRIDDTVQAMDADRNIVGRSALATTIDCIKDPAARRELVDVLATRTNDTTAEIVRSEFEQLARSVTTTAPAAMRTLEPNVWEVRFNAVRLGVPPNGAAFDPAPYADLMRPADPGAPFTGAGATGIDPTQAPGAEISRAIVRELLTLDNPANPPQGTRLWDYANPLTKDGAPYWSEFSSRPVEQRIRQAELFLSQPVASPMKDVWGPTPPSRADVIAAAAAHYNLDPATVGAFMLTEQWDQSQLEDSKDYAALTVRAGSVGIAQIHTHTAGAGAIRDTVSDKTMAWSGVRQDVGRLLSDDVVSIFGAARYIRQVADQGAALTAPPAGAATGFPGLDLGSLAGNSAAWSRDTLRAVGSEYTSRAWDGKWVSGWGSLVATARDEIVASGVFR